MAPRAVKRVKDPRHHSQMPAGLDQTPLAREVERLSDPGHEPDERDLMSLAAKYFFAFVHPGAHANPVPPDEIGSLLEMYARCKSLNEPDDDIEIMNRLRRFAPALSLAADTGRSGLLLRELLAQHPGGSPSRYLGLDLHTGAGLFVLGHSILARRSGYPSMEVWGVEADEMAAMRAGELLRDLGAGNVVAANPVHDDAYEMLSRRPVSLITSTECATDTLPLSAARFFDSFSALFRALGPGAERTAFFPEGIIAYSRDMNASLVLSKDNEFQRPPEFADAVFHPQGLLVDGRILPLHRLALSLRDQIR